MCFTVQDGQMLIFLLRDTIFYEPLEVSVLRVRGVPGSSRIGVLFERCEFSSKRECLHNVYHGLTGKTQYFFFSALAHLILRRVRIAFYVLFVVFACT